MGAMSFLATAPTIWVLAGPIVFPIIATLCWRGRERERRQTALALEREKRATQVALERERRQTLVAAACLGLPSPSCDGFQPEPADR